MRRIILAALAVVTILFCVVLQTLPLIFTEHGHYFFDFDYYGTTATISNEGIDPLLPELMKIRDIQNHAIHCGKEFDRSKIVTINGSGKLFDCSDGVLHIPPAAEIPHLELPPSQQNLYSTKLMRTGISASWKFPCNIPHSNSHNHGSSRCFPSEFSTPSFDDTCSASNSSSPSNGIPLSQSQCFRGVHDGLIENDEIDDLLRMGAYLVEEREGTHFDMHRNVSILLEYAPTVVAKLRSLLQSDDYYSSVNSAGRNIHPVAFRVSVTLPLDPDNWHFPKSAIKLVKTVNRTALAKWEELILASNYDTTLFFSLFKRPYRNPCILLSDIEASDDFLFHTSVFLSGEEDFTGGIMLYVDDDNRNSNPRRKIQSGLAIDGSRGRVVVSTGGLENKRCRLPTKDGIRAVLQVWWDCAEK